MGKACHRFHRHLHGALNTTVVALALPDIKRSHASFADIQWVVNAYALTFGAFLLTGGSLTDLLGRRHIFVMGKTRICGVSLELT